MMNDECPATSNETMPASPYRDVNGSVACKFVPLAAAMAVGLLAMVPATADARAPGAGLARDFVTGNVCLDEAGKPMIGVSPIDGNPACVSTRDLKPGEKLPYHQRDLSRSSARQLRRSNSFVAATGIGDVYIHTYDYQSDPNAPPNAYDSERRRGGGTIAAISNKTLSFVATQLGRQSLQFFVGAECIPGKPVTAAALKNSWVLAPLDQLAGVSVPGSVPQQDRVLASGIVNSKSRIVHADGNAICPRRLGTGSTKWSIRPVTYPAVYKNGPRKGQHIRLWTLIAERTGRPARRRDSALAFERAYFTRELGWTRWEVWKTAEARARGRNGRAATLAARITRTGRCDLPSDAASDSKMQEPAAPAGLTGRDRTNLLLVGCVDMTGITPPQTPHGDPPPVGKGTWFGSIGKGTKIFTR